MSLTEATSFPRRPDVTEGTVTLVTGWPRGSRALVLLLGAGTFGLRHEECGVFHNYVLGGKTLKLELGEGRCVQVLCWGDVLKQGSQGAASGAGTVFSRVFSKRRPWNQRRREPPLSAMPLSVFHGWPEGRIPTFVTPRINISFEEHEDTPLPLHPITLHRV